MNGDDLRDVRPGDPFFDTARRHNGLNDLLRQAQASRLPVNGSPALAPNDPCDIRVLNGTTNTIGQFGILGIDRPLNDPTSSNGGSLLLFKGEPAWRGVKPTAADHLGRFVIAQQPIIPGGVGTCRAAGVSLAKVNVTSADDTTADLTDNDTTKLTSGPGVAEILWKPSGATGLQWCAVRLGGGGGLPPLQYPGETYVSKADLTVSGGFYPLHEMNEGM